MAKLAAIDTSERDRALLELEKERTEGREARLRLTELNVRLKLQQNKIDQLESDNRSVWSVWSVWRLSLTTVQPQEIQREGRRAAGPEPGETRDGAQAGRRAGTEVGLREETRGVPA